MADMTKMAGQKINLTAADYKKTIDTYFADPEKRSEVNKKDVDVRMALNTKPVD